MQLKDLPTGARARVIAVTPAAPELEAGELRRLGELGFIRGEPLHLLRRGPGGREPLAVQVGDSVFALRWLEASCIEVEPV